MGVSPLFTRVYTLHLIINYSSLALLHGRSFVLSSSPQQMAASFLSLLPTDDVLPHREMELD